MKIDTIIFDLDGTVLNTNDLIVKSFQHTYKVVTGEEKNEEEILKSFGEPLSITLEREIGTNIDEAVKIYRDFHYARFEELISLFQGIDDVIRALSDKGYKLGLATSRMRYTTMLGLKKFGIDQYFKSVVTADDCVSHKPNPEPLLKVLKALGSQPEKSLMIGDSAFDIQGAKNANVKSAIVSWSVLPEEIYMNENPDFIINRVEDILVLVDKIGVS